MQTQRTYSDIATNFALWAEFVDPSAEISRQEFDALTDEQKIEIMVFAFGPEASEEQKKVL